MKAAGVVLYIFWLFLLILKYTVIPKDENFLYRHIFWGKLSWYRNSRTLILLAALFMIELFLPLRSLYALFLLTGVIIIIISFANIRNHTGKAAATSLVFLLGLLITSFSAFFVFN
ncbi:hypothetical protein [Liquorilactobacillus oeni]|uniref:hypothetical protein n=1 Tax=Liquorilactobacillus oeni TaxID=303241 RepID=UPI00070FF660|nr:hypothetical protein [Liquorilactobacillus oeni]